MSDHSPKIANLPVESTTNNAPQRRGKLPGLYELLKSNLHDTLVRQDVAIENIVADQHALADLLETAAKKSADDLASHTKQLKDHGLL